MTWLWYSVPIMYYILQNNYYGWNRFPQSDSELLVDGITLLLLSVVGIGIAICKELGKK